MVVVAVSAGHAMAQTAATRIYDEQLRVKLDQIDPEAREKDVDVGGWLNMAIFNYDDATAPKFEPPTSEPTDEEEIG